MLARTTPPTLSKIETLGEFRYGWVVRTAPWVMLGLRKY